MCREIASLMGNGRGKDLSVEDHQAAVEDMKAK
jgi:hypothetical protein